METTALDERPTHLDLFSGIGGFALAAQWAGFRTIGFCEIDKYCQKVLAKNFMAQPHSAGSWSADRNPLHEGRKASEDRRESVPENSEGRNGFAEPDVRTASPIFSNIFDLDARDFAGVTLITGGFPCQPFSVAGKRRGAEDYRAIWPEMFRVIREAQPAWVLGENVPGIIPMELDNVLSDLESIGYATRAFVIPACAVDAKHRRDRLWIIGRNMADGNGKYREELQRRNQLGSETGETTPRRSDETTGRFWLPEPDVGRVAHGVRNRVDRLKGLGNAIVPQVAYEILREIRKLI